MGFFDFLKPKVNPVVEELISRFDLRKELSDCPTIEGSAFPEWYIGSVHGVQLTVRDIAFGEGAIEVVVGEMLEMVDYGLQRTDGFSSSTPAGEDALFSTYVKTDHPASRAWLFSVPPHPYAELSVLEEEAVLDSLERLSRHVQELSIYRWGIETQYEKDADASAIHTDIQYMVRMYQPMDKYRLHYGDRREELKY